MSVACRRSLAPPVVQADLSVSYACRSHNPLGDDGLRELLVGIKRLRARDIGGHLEVRLDSPQSQRRDTTLTAKPENRNSIYLAVA